MQGFFAFSGPKIVWTDGNFRVDFGNMALVHGTVLALCGTVEWHSDGTFVFLL